MTPDQNPQDPALPAPGDLAAALSAVSLQWTSDLHAGMLERYGEHGAEVASRWAPRLSAQYRALIGPNDAAADVMALDALERSGEDFVASLREEHTDGSAVTRVVLMSRSVKTELSRAIRMLEDLGLNVLDERASRVTFGEADAECVWIQDFGVLGPGGRPLDLPGCADRVTAAISAVWHGTTESDALHRLIVTTELSYQRLQVLRAYRRYRQRIGSRYTEGFQNDVVVSNPGITAALVRLFELRFDPSREADADGEQALKDEITAQINRVSSLDHDRILRNQLALIDATVRTNAYVPGHRALALKLRAADIPALPQPAPMWEVYVLSPDVEGVHIRGGTIARGGLRWSDREDFRLEVWGLMRAQMVKNAVIVPAGAKGGFRLRREPAGRSELPEAVEAAYVDFIGALLDVTDTRDGERVVGPPGVRRRDGDDPYLVVAADKGTARFSDTANRVALERGFWLGDAFASGGSHGYDHKALGITARGAWESVRRHFREIGVDPERDPVTVAGIGDMSGDVFGNGMLLSRSLRLVAAYDHRHVFIDPDPGDGEAAWNERRRLFELPGSSWDDYDRGLISAGGGVFARDAKWVELSDEIRELLGITDVRLAPSDLIRAVLRAEVDLLWNGGIGTVVKASDETDADAQDRASDAVRVNGRELRARVVAEGGNLGFTQRARIEYALAGGAINADFIDNSGGVDSSDREVNLKILLSEAIRRGELKPDERDGVLEAVTADVCRLVLAENARQARIITDEQRRSPNRIAAYEELMVALEEHAGLVRADHDLPGTDVIEERHAAGAGMTRPELAVLLSLAKIAVTQELMESPLVDDRALEGELHAYFPRAIGRRFGGLFWDHPLRRELLAMLTAGDTADVMGVSFVFRRAAEFGVSPSDVVRAYLIARDVCDAPALIAAIDAAGLEPDLTWELAAVVQDAVRQVSRWYLRHEGDGDAAIAELTAAHHAAAQAITAEADVLDGGPAVEQQRWMQSGVPERLAAAVARCRLLPFAPYLAGAAERSGVDVKVLVGATAALREALPIDALQFRIAALPAGTRVARWANQALRDDYLSAVSHFSARLVIGVREGTGTDQVVASGLAERERAVRRLEMLVREAQRSQHTQVAGTTLAVRQLREMADWSGTPLERAPQARTS